jgi:hypothetical protein
MSKLALIAWDNTKYYHGKLLWIGREKDEWKYYDKWVHSSKKKDTLFAVTLEFRPVKFLWWFWVKTKIKELVKAVS